MPPVLIDAIAPPTAQSAQQAVADVADAASLSSLHVVFSAECIPAFDWESYALFYSFYRLRHPGKITRLLACSDEQLKTYSPINLNMGPTFVHRNMRFDHHFNDDEMNDEFHDRKGKGYASYNKPYSVTAWLRQTDVRETWVLMMDTDMILRAPIDPVKLGVRRGKVVSAEYTYLHGTRSGMARRFIDESLHRRMAQVGGFHIFHREDLRVISPRWVTAADSRTRHRRLLPDGARRRGLSVRARVHVGACAYGHAQVGLRDCAWMPTCISRSRAPHVLVRKFARTRRLVAAQLHSQGARVCQRGAGDVLQ